MERLILTSKLIEERERAHVQDKKDKAQRKSGSGKHVQKGGVIYKGRGAKQSMETNKEYDDWRANTRILNSHELYDRRIRFGLR